MAIEVQGARLGRVDLELIELLPLVADGLGEPGQPVHPAVDALLPDQISEALGERVAALLPIARARPLLHREHEPRPGIALLLAPGEQGGPQGLGHLHRRPLVDERRPPHPSSPPPRDGPARHHLRPAHEGDPGVEVDVFVAPVEPVARAPASKAPRQERNHLDLALEAPLLKAQVLLVRERHARPLVDAELVGDGHLARDVDRELPLLVHEHTEHPRDVGAQVRHLVEPVAHVSPTLGCPAAERAGLEPALGAHRVGSPALDVARYRVARRIHIGQDRVHVGGLELADRDVANDGIGKGPQTKASLADSLVARELARDEPLGSRPEGLPPLAEWLLAAPRPGEKLLLREHRVIGAERLPRAPPAALFAQPPMVAVSAKLLLAAAATPSFARHCSLSD